MRDTYLKEIESEAFVTQLHCPRRSLGSSGIISYRVIYPQFSAVNLSVPSTVL